LELDFDTQVLGFDVETQGRLPEYALQPFRYLTGEAWISAAAWTRGETTAGKLFPKTPVLRQSFEMAVAKDLYVCGWNVAFDAAWLIAAGLEDLVFKVRWLDAMLLWKHWVVAPEPDDVPATKRKSYKLEAAMHEFFPAEAGFKEFTNFQTQDPEELKRLLFRCQEDTRFAVRLGQMFWGMLPPNQRRAALIEAQCIPQVAKTLVLGIKSSQEHAEALKVKLIKEGEAAKAALRAANPGIEFVESGLTPKQLKTMKAEHPETDFVNLGSPKQLATLLYKTWGLPIQGVSKKTQEPSTDKYALYELAFIDPRAKLLKDVREAKGNCTKYAEGTLKSLAYNGDGFVRPGARIFSTYSSRMTYSSSQKRKGDKEQGTKNEEYPTGIALHQWKRGKDFRRLVRPPEGYSLVELDFAGQEFGWMAVASGDETMLSLREPGEDAHSYMGAQIAQIDYRTLIQRVAEDDAEANLQRKLGKFSNLSFQYRIGSKSATKKARVDYELDIEEAAVKQFLATYKATFIKVSGGPAGMGGYWQTQIYKCKQLGYAETFAGRRVQLTGNWSGRDAWQMESSAINYPIQGTGGDQKYLALAVARNLLPKFNGYFYFELHDGLFFIFPHAVARKAAETFKYVLSNLPYKKAWGVDLPISFPVDAKISAESWGDLKNL
jgi:hypothetical protein